MADVFVADVSRPGDVDGMVRATVERFGQLDCAHNNAGVAGPSKPLDEYSDDDSTRSFASTSMARSFACAPSSG